MNRINKLPVLGTWLRRFLSEYITVERNLAVNTQKSYRDTFKLLLPFVGNRLRKQIERLHLDDLSAKVVLEFLAYLEDERGCSIQTRNQRLNAIRAFARYVASSEPVCVDWSASIRAIATKKAAPQPLSWLNRAEIEALIAAPDIKRHRGRIEHAMLLFLYNTGARVSEAVRVRVSDFCLDEQDERHTLVVLHGKGGKVRQCPLWPRTMQLLAQLMDGKQPSDMVFISQSGQPYTRYGVYRLVERNAQRVASLADRKVTPHCIRHSSACHLLQAGADLNTIRAWLGHVSLDTTNIYVEIDIERKRKAMELCDAASAKSMQPWKQEAGLMEFLDSL